MKTTIMLLLFVAGTFFVPVSAFSQQNQKIECNQCPVLRGNGFTDDTDALNAWGRGERVIFEGKVLGDVLQRGNFLITWKIRFNRPNSTVRFNTFVRRYSGFDSLRQIDYGWGVRHYQNRIIDEDPFRRTRKTRRFINDHVDSPIRLKPSTVNA